MGFLDTEWRGIETAASSVDYFERTRIFDNRGQFWIGPELLDHLRIHGGLTFQAIKYTTTVRNYSLENIVLDADSLLLLKDGLTIHETAYFVPGDKSNRPHVDNDALVSLVTDETVIIGYNNAHLGYQHWLTQCIPAIDWSARRQTRPIRLLLPQLQPWQEDLIRLLGRDKLPRLTPRPGKQYLLPRVEYSDFINGSTSFSVCLSMRETAQRILNALPKIEPLHKAIYVPCTNPYYGSVANEDEVISLLLLRGVHVVDFKTLDTAARINLFHNAELVIGPHGEGLTDVIFCKPGAVLWEWMPRHYQNAVFNRLAQAARVDYRGDLFDNLTDGEQQGRWLIDIPRIVRGLAELSNHFAVNAANLDRATVATRANPAGLGSVATKPIDDLMLAFESLGANCEFGLVQRHAGVEPLGLLRFAAMAVAEDVRVEKLVDALRRGFEGLGAIETINVYLPEEPGRREFLARESVYNLQYHTGMFSDEITADALRLREVKRLGFLRRKLQEDLQSGDKIWVWQSANTTEVDQVIPLLNILRLLGPNTLVWVVEADNDHPAGTAERLDRDFIKGYVEHFASPTNALDLSAFSWIEMCQEAHGLCHPVSVSAEMSEVGDIVPRRTLSAMEFLMQNAPPSAPNAPRRPVAVTVAPKWRVSLKDAVNRIWLRR